MHSLGLMCPSGMDRLHRAFVAAALAGVAALAIATQPIEQPQPRRDRHRRAERAQIAAERALDEQARRDHRARIQNERPAAREAQDDRGLERLDFGSLLGRAQRAERNAEQHQEDDVFQRGQALMDAEGNLELRNL